MITRFPHPNRPTIAAWVVGAMLLLQPVTTRVSAAQDAQPDSGTTASATGGTVVLQAAGAGSEEQLGTTARAVGWGDILQAYDDGEAALNYSNSLAVRLFHQSQAQILGNNAPDDPTAIVFDSAEQALDNGAFPAYELLQGATYNSTSVDPDIGSPVQVSSPGVTIASTSGKFLLYHDPVANTTCIIVTDGTATVTAAGTTIDVPSAFLTFVMNGAAPSDPQPASRATVGTTLPPVEDLTNGALADTDILAAPQANATVVQDGGNTALLPALADLGGLVPFPTTATLRAGKTTVWYWPQRQGGLDTVSQNDTRPVRAGDGVNVSEDGRADLNFQDFNVQIFRHAQLQMIPTLDQNGYGLGYDLLQGATLNTVSANALQELSSDRIGVRAGWAVVTAVYTAHPTASEQLAQAGDTDEGMLVAQSIARGPGGLSAAPGDAQFLVNYDGTNSWVVVTQGTVQVEPVAASSASIPAGGSAGPPVLVSAGFQTWVEPSQPPTPPRPATRSEIGNQFPTIEELTGNELSDAQVLAGSAVVLPVTPAAVAPTTAGSSNLPSLTGIARPKLFSNRDGQTIMMVAGTHSDTFSLSLDSPAPAPNGVSIALSSADPSKAAVAASVTIPAGSTTTTFRVTGFAPTVDYARSIDRPVVITATGPDHSARTIAVSVGTPLLLVHSNEPRTTTSSGNFSVQVSLDTYGSAATPTDSALNAALNVAFSVTDPTKGGAPSSIVTVTPSQVTIPTGGASGVATINKPTGVGTYQINVSAAGLTTVSLAPVIVSK